MAQLLGFLKLDAMVRKNIGRRIIKELIDSGKVSVRSFEYKKITRDLVDIHYAHVTARPFYPWLAHYSTHGSSYVMILEVAENNIELLRVMLGNTLSHKAEPGSLRQKFGIYAGVNCLHMSDSVESGRAELNLWRRTLAIQDGKCDMSVAEFVNGIDEKIPDNTKAIRQLCAEMVFAGKEIDEKVIRIEALLREEAPGVGDADIAALMKAILDGALR